MTWIPCSGISFLRLSYQSLKRKDYYRNIGLGKADRLTLPKAKIIILSERVHWVNQWDDIKFHIEKLFIFQRVTRNINFPLYLESA